MELISSAEGRFVTDGVAQNLRADGRAREVFRPFSLDTGVIPQATGSARLRLGATHILACVKAEIGSPPAGRPWGGRIEVSVDCSPTATPAFRAALSNSVLPKVEVVMGEGEDGEPELEVVDDPDEGVPLDTSSTPIIVTLNRLGKHVIVDATPEEEAVAEASLCVAVRPDGRIVSATKGGNAGVHPSVLSEMLDTSNRVAMSLHRQAGADTIPPALLSAALQAHCISNADSRVIIKSDLSRPSRSTINNTVV
ncbi:unnamed protein product [Closterium sp. NIES-54]